MPLHSNAGLPTITALYERRPGADFLASHGGHRSPLQRKGILAEVFSRIAITLLAVCALHVTVANGVVTDATRIERVAPAFAAAALFTFAASGYALASTAADRSDRPSFEQYLKESAVNTQVRLMTPGQTKSARGGPPPTTSSAPRRG